MPASLPRMPALLIAMLIATGGCADPAPIPLAGDRQVAGADHRGERAPDPARTARLRPPSTAAAASPGQWIRGGDPDAPMALWGAPASEAVLTMRCDGESGRIVLEREAHALPDDVRILTLEADGVRMQYPAERVPTELGASLVTRIALDAPVLDRLLVTPGLAVVTGPETLRTGAPGPALGPVLEACRARH